MRSFQIDEVMPLDHGNDLPTAIRDGILRHIHDLKETDLYKEREPTRVRMVEEEGYRTYLVVPLIAKGVSIGGIVLSRREVAPFSDENIALLETFAAQAVIAIDNARQFRNLRDRLDRAAATREILNAISSARDDEGPVFDAILSNARKLCDAPFAALVLGRESDGYQTMIAHHGAVQSTEDIYSEGRVPMDPKKSFAARAIIEKRPVHLPNMKDTEEYRAGVPNVLELCDLQGIRTNLFVPLIKDGEGIGCFIIFRYEVRPYSDEQIALVETFATQAVIALENVRQFRDLQTRLVREATTRDILGLLARVREDEQPVFDAILDNATRLCGAPNASLILGREGDKAQIMVANCGATTDETRALYNSGGVPMDPHDSLVAQAIIEQRTIHVPDMMETVGFRAGHPRYVMLVENQGIRTNLFVPLVGPDGGVGCFILWKSESEPFTQDQISQVETFAAQASIALENVRQFRDLQTRLDREASTREVLEVISRSRDDDQPVFDAILENAQRICGAPFGNLNMVTEDGAHLEIVADGVEPFEPFRPGWRWPIDSGLLVARSVREKKVFQLEDAAEDPLFAAGDEDRVTVVKAGVRTVLTVPLVSGGVGVGSMGLYRTELRPFSADEIALVETFAAQAVIAIENARQFRALQDRTAEVQTLNASLEAKVEEQVGEIARMGQLKQFMSPAVADALVSAGDEQALSSHRALIATLFCDIRGFTAFCETAEPEETIEVLQAYHEQMGELIAEYGGGVDKRMGDGIMVIFNDPLPCDDPAGDAVRLAVAMRARMRELAKRWKKLGHRLGFGVGVSLGYATVGMVGSAGRFDYTASGTAVNTAARPCDIAEDGEILISPRTWAAVEDDFEGESRGAIEMKGIREPIEVFSIIAPG